MIAYLVGTVKEKSLNIPPLRDSRGLWSIPVFCAKSGAVRDADRIWGFCLGISSRTPQNRTIGVNLGIFGTVLVIRNINMPPLQGLVPCLKTLL